MLYASIFVRIFMEAFILRLVLILVAKHEADLSFPKLAMVVAGILFGGLFVQMMLVGTIPPLDYKWFYMLVNVALATTLIMVFCWVSFLKSILVVILYVACHLLITVAYISVFSPDILNPKKSSMRKFVPSANQGAPPQGYYAPPPTKPTSQPAPKKKSSKKSFWAKLNPFSSDDKKEDEEKEISSTDTHTPKPKDYSPGLKGAKERAKASGIMSDSAGKYEAYINGKIVQIGGIIEVEHEDRIYRLKAKNITRKQVEWELVNVE